MEVYILHKRCYKFYKTDVGNSYSSDRLHFSIINSSALDFVA